MLFDAINSTHYWIILGFIPTIDLGLNYFFHSSDFKNQFPQKIGALSHHNFIDTLDLTHYKRALIKSLDQWEIPPRFSSYFDHKDEFDALDNCQVNIQDKILQVSNRASSTILEFWITKKFSHNERAQTSFLYCD